MAHSSARLTVGGRLLLIERIVVEGWPVAQAAGAQGISRATAYKWWKRWRVAGARGLADRSSAPHARPRALAQGLVEAIVGLRRRQAWGPHRIAWELGLPRSTVYGVLRRLGLNRLAALDRTTRRPIRYVREHPGELLHLDIKPLGRIPPGGGKRLQPGWPDTRAGYQSPAGRGLGFEYVHVAVDDASRWAYAEVLPDERAATAAAFLGRVVAAFAAQDIQVERVLTDNGSCYRAHAFARAACQLGVRPKRTRPYRPQTNGKAEAFIRTLLREWAYLRPYFANADRRAALPAWLHTYNYQRPHTGLDGRTPAQRLGVNNLSGKNS